MNLDITNWKEFRFGDLISEIYKAKAINKDDLTVATDSDNAIRYITRTGENNGCELLADVRDIDDKMIENGNAISIGDTTATCFYQEERFITGDHMVVVRADAWLNSYTALYVVAILTNEQYKYSYGRAYLMDRIKDTIIKLPADTEGNPDWQFMEDYIKSLHHKPLTTKNKKGQAPVLNTQTWKEFLLFDYFDVIPGKYHYPEEYEDGTTPYYSASNENNGIGSYIDLPPDFEGNRIVTGKVGCTAFYAPEPFCATSDVNIFIPKFSMSAYVGLFVANVINYSENYKWAYGRQCRVGNSKRIVIKLPSDSNGNPDWQFMENYIKALPYGDRL